MYPTTDSDRLDHMHLIIRMSELDEQRGEPVHPDTILKLKACYGNLSGNLQLVHSAEHQLAICRTPYLAGLDDLILHSRDYWHGMQRKARREDTPEVLNFFREPGQNPLPVGRTAAAWAGFASRLIDGAGAAREAGYSPECQPSVGDLERVLDRLLALQKDYLSARLALRDARTELADARDAADWSLRNQVLALRLAYPDKRSLQAALVRYGFRSKIGATRRKRTAQATSRAATVNSSAAIHLLPFAMAALPFPGSQVPRVRAAPAAVETMVVPQGNAAMKAPPDDPRLVPT